MALRVGIIGAGWIGQWHAARWRQLPVELVGFYDVSHQMAEQAAGIYGGSAFDHVEHLIRTVDIVQVCTPTVHHRDYVLEAAALRKHIFCEKPLARTITDAQAMINACEQAGVRLFVGQVLRFFPQYRRAKALIDTGAIGRPRVIRLLRAAGHPAVSEARNWFKDVEKTGGCMLEGAVHDLDFARWAVGEIDSVYARGLTYRSDLKITADHALAVLRFRSGAIGQVEGSWMVTDGRFRQRFSVAGEDGLLEYDSQPRAQISISLREQAVPALLPVEPLAREDEPYYHQLAHMLDCLEHDKAFLVSPQDGLEALRLSLAVLKSMQTGAVVKLEELN